MAFGIENIRRANDFNIYIDSNSNVNIFCEVDVDMKCPYREFKDCIVQECPSCDYEVEEYETTDGKYPTWMPSDEAIKQGYAWKIKKKKYIFKGCKLVDNNVQPMPKSETHIHNKTETNVAISHSIF